MSIVSPPAITALPAPPDPNDRATFNARAYPWSVAQQTFGTQVGLVASNVYSNANEALGQANNAAASAVAATNNGAAQVALATTQANNAAASAIAATNNGAAQVALAAQAAAISAASANYKGLWSALTGALNTPASVSHNNVFWALNNPLADVAAAIPGISAAWTQISGGGIKRVARASNTQLTSVDASKIISMTGTWTQTFAGAAALGDGWFCYLQNNGTGDITLDPSGSELIDGLTSYVMYPGEVRLVQCDGTALTSVILQAFTRTFTASGTWTKPPGYRQFGGLLWGGGGSGACTANAATGGGGGACHPFLLSAAALAATVSVVIAAGGAAVAPSANGNVGGTSTFGSVSAYGGGGGSIAGGGGCATGGGALSAGATVSGASYAGGAPASSPYNTTYVSGLDNPGLGGGGAGFNGSSTVYGGNAAWGGAASANGAVGKSIYGGGAGGSYGIPTAGTSVYGGAGGNGSAAGAGTAGVAPAGGGGGGTATSSGAGARGEMRIWGVM